MSRLRQYLQGYCCTVHGIRFVFRIPWVPRKAALEFASGAAAVVAIDSPPPPHTRPSLYSLANSALAFPVRPAAAIARDAGYSVRDAICSLHRPRSIYNNSRVKNKKMKFYEKIVTATLQVLFLRSQLLSCRILIFCRIYTRALL